MLDKEPIRRWLMERNFKGEGPIPVIPDEYREELTRHYLQSFKVITGVDCVIDGSDPVARIERNLRDYLHLPSRS
jgi:phosphoribosylaminoimidazole-succinocarboxamide synthase